MVRRAESEWALREELDDGRSEGSAFSNTRGDADKGIGSGSETTGMSPGDATSIGDAEVAVSVASWWEKPAGSVSGACSSEVSSSGRLWLKDADLGVS